jgi:rod shape determining protein RodA
VLLLQIDYKLRDKFDFGLIIPVLVLILIGLTAIYSSTVNHPTASGNFNRQVLWAAVSFIVFIVMYSIPTNTFKMISIPTYLIAIGLLVLVLFMGRKISGAKSWLDLGFFGFQPSELAKVGTILLMAAFLSRKNTNLDNFKDILLALTIGFIPVALILLEPDMGTAMVFIVLILTLIFWKGISLFRSIHCIITCLCCHCSLVWYHLFYRSNNAGNNGTSFIQERYFF